MLPFVYRCKKCGTFQESQEPPSVIHICYTCGTIDIPLFLVDLDLVRPEGIIKLLENELRRRCRKQKVGVKLLWTDRTGTKVEVSKMTESHVKNILKRVKKFIYTD